MRSRSLKLAYLLRHHYWGNWSLDRWLVTLGLAGALVSLLLRLRRLLAGNEPALWLLPALLVLLALVVTLHARWAARQFYIEFEPQPGLASPQGRALAPADKILIHTTGRFEVQGKTKVFANLLAYWRTFASREHAIMAIVHDSRFLLLGVPPERDLGLWYAFFCPDKMLEVMPGRLTYGGQGQPALRVTYQPPRPPSPPPTRFGQRPRPRPLPPPETVYLIFDDEESRVPVWADLLADWPDDTDLGRLLGSLPAS